ncbi:1-aminocyclopropane-1-carboxylate deaminase/D-cysteine desulfhydrase [Belliella pelovolcani]|uniref:1-aminocyclopropane-1-carboxylate deaminase/D-cysteine desulfhydrase n=1 Tax=Belliella pelovolcani TaxID=529505 RepID=UPI00391C32E4
MLIPREISIDTLHHPLLERLGISVAIKRLDQVHPLASGNKFFKLKYNLVQAKREGKKKILTFGGAHSNHIYATASACHAAGFESIGIIRGEETLPLNPTLAAAREKGMELHYVSRGDYRNKKEKEFLNELRKTHGDFYHVPEGGTNSLAIKGTSEILSVQDNEYSYICTSIGTGGTFAGIAASLGPHQVLLGFSSLKGDFIYQEMADLLSNHQIAPKGKIEIENQYHFGGYGKTNADLLAFIRWFYGKFQIVLEPIYTGKMCYGVFEKIKNGDFPKGSKILLLHTGGLQGLAGFNQRFGTSLPL